MPAPNGFTWVDPPLLAAMAQPGDPDEYVWLREQGVQLVISLCEDPPRRSWLNEAGLFSMHIPVEDMHPPAPKQIELCLQAIDKAHARNFAVAIHCGAGLGRTGTMVACYFVKKGMTAPAAIAPRSPDSPRLDRNPRAGGRDQRLRTPAQARGQGWVTSYFKNPTQARGRVFEPSGWRTRGLEDSPLGLKYLQIYAARRGRATGSA